jgi:hypothetical protein
MVLQFSVPAQLAPSPWARDENITVESELQQNCSPGSQKAEGGWKEGPRGQGPSPKGRHQ